MCIRDSLWHTAELYAKPVLGIREDDVAFSAAKLFFAYGLGNGLTFPLSVGATVVLMAERPTPQAVFQRLVRHRPTVFYGVPTLYASMLAAPDLPPREQVAMRVCTSAGEALRKADAAVPALEKGAAGGVTPLDAAGKVPAAHLPPPAIPLSQKSAVSYTHLDVYKRQVVDA